MTKLWIKFMEGDYMNLFKTEEFVDAFHQVVNHYADFQGAQQKVLSDVLQFFPVSTREELDEPILGCPCKSARDKICRRL